MYNVTPNQKEQILCKIINALDAIQNNGTEDAKDFLMRMYLKVQNLHAGGSLHPTEVSRLKKFFSSKKR